MKRIGRVTEIIEAHGEGTFTIWADYEIGEVIQYSIQQMAIQYSMRQMMYTHTANHFGMRTEKEVQGIVLPPQEALPKEIKDV